MIEFIKNLEYGYGKPLLNSKHFIGDLFTDIIETGHASTKRNGYYFLGIDSHQDVLHPRPITKDRKINHGWTAGEYICPYGKPAQELLDLVLPYMSEGKIGHFSFKRWEGDGGLQLFVTSKNYIAHYWVCEVTET